MNEIIFLGALRLGTSAQKVISLFEVYKGKHEKKRLNERFRFELFVAFGTFGVV